MPPLPSGSPSTSGISSPPKIGAAASRAAASRRPLDHSPYSLFRVAPFISSASTILKVIQAAGFLNAVAGGRPKPFNFRPDLRIQTLIETVHASSRVGAWPEVRKSFDLARICSDIGALRRADAVPPHCSVTVGMCGFTEFL